MSTDTAPAWQQDLDTALTDLTAAAPRLAAEPSNALAQMARTCLLNLEAEVEEWAGITLTAKGLPQDSPWRGEEIALGPLGVARQLRLALATLEATARNGAPELPSLPRVDGDGRVRVPVLPAKGLFDGIAFKGFRAEVVMQEHVTAHNLPDHIGAALRDRTPGVSLILGAGNVSCLATGDIVGQVLLAGRATLLKLHPHFASLAEVMGRVFAPLIQPGYLRILAGDGAFGAAASCDARVGRIHVTGSVDTFDRMVWGDDPAIADRRRENGEPLLDKEIVAELGNVTPWIIVPGEWSDRDLRFQAENLAGSIASNASFNCICPKVIITSSAWPQRERFLSLLRQALAVVEPRPAFYAGATERYLQLVGEPAGVAPGCLPWTVLQDVDPDTRPELFEQENFVCVSAETGLDATDPADFLDHAVRFCNERLAGTLAATVVIHPRQRKDAAFTARFESAIRRLRYGTISINHMPGIAYLMMATPWGGFPGADIHTPESGLGWSNNTFLLDGAEQTIFEGPFRVSPKPIWFPSNRNVTAICRALTALYLRPSVTRVPRLLGAALRG